MEQLNDNAKVSIYQRILAAVSYICEVHKYVTAIEATLSISKNTPEQTCLNRAEGSLDTSFPLFLQSEEIMVTERKKCNDRREDYNAFLPILLLFPDLHNFPVFRIGIGVVLASSGPFHCLSFHLW